MSLWVGFPRRLGVGVKDTSGMVAGIFTYFKSENGIKMYLALRGIYNFSSSSSPDL